MKRTFGRMGLALVVGLLLAALASAGVWGQAGAKRVGLVVRYGDGTEHLEIVSVAADANTYDVLRASSLDIETADYGGGFIALCRIGPDGCPAEDCFCAAESWAFWILNPAGPAWESAAVGITGHTPADGGVVGFSWTGFDANWNPEVEPPVYTFAQIEALTQPTDIPEPATMLLLGGGLAGLASYVGLRRRARR